MEDCQLNPIRGLLRRLPSGDKHFNILVSVAEIGISNTLRGTNWIKNLKWTPSGYAFADSLGGIKHFGILVSEPEIGLSSILHGINWIKHKILKCTPSGSAFADSLRGIKHF